MNRLLAITTILLALAAGCGGSNDSHKYPSKVRESFMQSCSGDSSNNAGSKVCECSFEALEKKYTAKEFTALQESISKGGPADDLISIVTKCAQQN